MRQVRRNVFETNSSSTHSVTIRHNGLEPNYMHVQDDGCIHTKLGEFGWEVVNYCDPEDRLSYLMTMMAMKSGIYSYWYTDQDEEDFVQKLMDTDEFQRISHEIAKYAGCDGVIIDPSDGYIDHQSHDDYGSVNDFLKEYDTDILEFVFGSGTIVHTDNDNH